MGLQKYLRNNRSVKLANNGTSRMALFASSLPAEARYPQRNPKTATEELENFIVSFTRAAEKLATKFENEYQSKCPSQSIAASEKKSSGITKVFLLRSW